MLFFYSSEKRGNQNPPESRYKKIIIFVTWKKFIHIIGLCILVNNYIREKVEDIHRILF